MKKKQNSKKNVHRFVGFGYLDFNFSLDITNEDCSNFQIDMSAINSISDLEFITTIEPLMDKIKITSNSSTINTLFYLIKCSKKKPFVEFCAYNSFNYNEGEEFMSKMFIHATEQNFIFISESKISASPKSVLFSLLHNGESYKDFYIGIQPEPEKKEGEEIEKEKENAENKNENENENAENQENNENPENEDAEQKKKLESPRKLEDFLQNINCIFKDINTIYIDLNEILLNSLEVDINNVTLDEIVALLQFLTINFPDKKIFVDYPNIVSNIGLISIDSLNSLSAIMIYTDCFIFERKESISYFNLINQLHNSNYKEEKSKISDKQLEKLFLGSFTSKRNKHSKVGIFMDEFCKITIIEKQGNNVMNNSYPIDLHPKINHTNLKLIEEYKSNITIHKEFLKSVFNGSFIYKILYDHGIELSVNCSVELTKRVLEIFRLNMEFPTNPEFYIVNIKKSNSSILEKQKEDNFVLDCINKNKSSLGYYNPLRDYNLHSFFSSNVIRRHLKNVGFINTKGFLLEDPSKGQANSPLRKSNKYDYDLEKEKKLLIAIQENEQKNKENVRKSLLNRSKYLHDVQVMELERQVKTYEYKVETHPILPSFEKSMKLKPIKGNSLASKSMIVSDKVSIYLYFIVIFPHEIKE